MSLGEADAKFPGAESSDSGPTPTRENPAGVFPKSSPVPAPAQGVPGADGAPSNPSSVFANPFVLHDALIKLDDALTEAISAIRDEKISGVDGEGSSLLEKFEGWKDEVEVLRDRAMGGLQNSGRKEAPNSGAREYVKEEGGLFTD